MDPSYGDQVIEAPPEDDEEQKKPAPPASTGSPFIDALIGAVTGADLPSTGGGTNAAVDDPRGYGTDYAPSSPAPGYAFAPPAGNNGMDDPRGYGTAYGGSPSPNDAGGTGVDTYGPPAPSDWGSTNAAPTSDTPWDTTPYFPGAAGPAPRDWGDTNATPTATAIPPFAGGLFDPWTASAEAAGTTKNPITAMREADETRTAGDARGTVTAVAGVNRDNRTATAVTEAAATHAAGTATREARLDAPPTARPTQTPTPGYADRLRVAQEAEQIKSATQPTKEPTATHTPKPEATATPDFDARLQAAKEDLEIKRLAQGELSPTATKEPDPDKDATDGLKYLADAAKLEQDAPVVNHQRQVPIEAQMARDQGNFLLNRARIARGLPPVATATPARPGAAPAGADYGTPTADYGTPGPASTPLATISQAFARGPVQPDAVEQNTVSYGGLDAQTSRPPVDYGPGPDEAAALYAPQTTGKPTPAFDPAQADAIAAGRNAEESYAPLISAPAPRTRASATPTLPIGEFGGDTSGGAVPIDPDLMGKGATGADQQTFVDGILSRIPRAPATAPGQPGALPPTGEAADATAPPPRNGAVAPSRPAPAPSGAPVAIAPAVEQYRPLFAKYFGADADHAMQLATLESGGNALAHNTQGEDSRGLMQINVGPGGNTDLRGHDLFNPEQNIRDAAQVKARAGWGAWSTEALLQRGGQNAAMPGANGLPGTVSPGDMTADAKAGRPTAATPDDLNLAVGQAGAREASMPGAGAAVRAGSAIPRPALTGNEAQDNRNWVAWKLQTDPSFQIPGAEDTAAKAAAGPHKGDIPTNKPAAAADPGFKVGSAIPVSATNTYRLSDGTTKTLADMTTELRAAGWAGDVGNVQAVLEAYQRTVGKTLTPAPAGPLSQADRQAQVSRWTPNIAQVGAGLNVPADVALAAIDVVSQGDPTHDGGLMGVPAASVPAGTPLSDGNTSIKAGLTQLASLYAANGNDWGKAFGAYLTGLGIQPGAIDGAVSAFNTARSAYLAPTPPAAK